MSSDQHTWNSDRDPLPRSLAISLSFFLSILQCRINTARSSDPRSITNDFPEFHPSQLSCCFLNDFIANKKKKKKTKKTKTDVTVQGQKLENKETRQ